MEYFKAMADEADLPYQGLISMYLRDCAVTKRRVNMAWKVRASHALQRQTLQTAGPGC